jgi:hypothetical protein
LFVVAVELQNEFFSRLLVPDRPKIVRKLLVTTLPLALTLTSTALIVSGMFPVPPTVKTTDPPDGDHVGEAQCTRLVEATV